MKYTKFLISNYKGIDETISLNLETKPSTNIFTLVGLNESGKTSILEAINLLQNDQPEKEAHKMIHKSQKGNFNGSISVRAYVELDDEDRDALGLFFRDTDYILTSEVDHFIYHKEYLFTNSKFTNLNNKWTIDLTVRKKRGKKDLSLFDENKQLWQEAVAVLKSRMSKILYYENFLFDFPQRIYLEDKIDLSQQEIEYRKVLQDVLDSFDDGLNLKNHILNRLGSEATEEDKEALETTLNDIAQKMTDVIFGNWSDVFARDSKEITLSSGHDVQKGYYIELKIKQGNANYSINERSLGFRWFFSFLLFTEFRKARKDEAGETLFLLDEPASNLHQKSQIKLLDVFEKLTENSKIIYSTHSHYLINPKHLSGTYIIKNDAINYDNEQVFSNNVTKISATPYKQFVSNHPGENDQDHYQPILEAIHYTPGLLEPNGKIVLLEGKNDYYTFKLASQLLDLGRDLNFYPGASVSKYEDMLRLFVATNRKFLALFDGDRQGKSEQKKYIKGISEELVRRIHTLDQITEGFNNFCTEDLFSIEDRLMIVRMHFGNGAEYDKSKFNTSLQDIYINNKDITLSEETLDNLTSCITFLEEQFSKMD